MNKKLFKMPIIAMLAVGLIFSNVSTPLVKADLVKAQSLDGLITSMKRQSPSLYTCTIAKGKTMYLRTTIAPIYADNQDLKWTTSNKKIVTVSTTGKIKGINKGTAIIRAQATDGSKKYVSWKITVGTPVTSINTDDTKISLEAKQTYQIKASVSPKSATNKGISYSSTDDKVAVVNSKGKVTAVADGSADIILQSKDGRSSTKIPVSVAKIEKNIYIDTESMKKGDGLLVNETYDNIIVRGDIGASTKIILLGVTVNDSLIFETGTTYTVDISNSKINRVESRETIDNKVLRANSIFSTTNKPLTPILVARDNTKIDSIELKAGLAINQVGTATIGSVSVDNPSDNSGILLELDGVKSNVNIKSLKGSTMMNMTNCDVERMDIEGIVNISDRVSGTGSNRIKELNLSGTNNNIILDVAVETANITTSANNLILTFTRKITNLYNSGSQSYIMINDAGINKGVVTDLITSGNGAYISGNGTVGTINVKGARTNIALTAVPTPRIIISSYVTDTIVNGILQKPGTIMESKNN